MEQSNQASETSIPQAVNPIDVLAEVARAVLGDPTESDASPLTLDRNNFHGYARSPPERAYIVENDRSVKTNQERQRPGGRMEHNRLEKDRRAQLKTNFQRLKDVVPSLKDKKSSNLAILKGSVRYIGQLYATSRNQERTIQDLANTKSKLLRSFKKTKEEFEQRTGRSPDEVLNEAFGMDVDDAHDVDDGASDSTWSATEELDNMNDFDDEPRAIELERHHSASLQQQQMPPPPPVSQNPRGIPHPVIRQVPHDNVKVNGQSSGKKYEESPDQPLNLVSTTGPTVQGATVKKLQAKLASPKPVSTSQEITVSASSAASPVIGELPKYGFVRHRSKAQPTIVSAVPGFRMLPAQSHGGQSLLSNPQAAQTPFVPQVSIGMGIPSTTISANGFVTRAPTIRKVESVEPVFHAMQPLHDKSYQHVYVATGGNHNPWLTAQSGTSNILVVSSPKAPSVSSRVAL